VARGLALLLLTLALAGGGGASGAAPVSRLPWEGFPRWAPDGTRILFDRNTIGQETSWLVDRDGAHLRRVPGGSGDRAFSPDGRWIVWATHQRYGGALHSHVYLMRSDGSGLRRMTSGSGLDVGPRFSPDGRRILWIRVLQTTSRLWSMRVDGSGKRAVVGPGWNVGDFAFAPGRSRLLLQACPADAGCGFKLGDLYLARADGSRRARVTWSSLVYGGTWSADGRRIAFIDGGEPSRLVVLRADGSGRRVVAGDVDGYVWGPGDRLTYERRVSFRDRLWLVGADGSHPHPLLRKADSRGGNDDVVGDWSPDGTELAFAHGLSGGGARIYLVRPDGSGLRPLVSSY
jgi:Tol biopolymer transport system component